MGFICLPPRYSRTFAAIFVARALPRERRMARPRKREGGTGLVENDRPDLTAPQSAGDTTAANSDRNRVAARAYELYLRRGGGDGRDLDDWLEAERELNGHNKDRDPDSAA